MPCEEPDWISLAPYVKTFGADSGMEHFERWGPWLARPLARVGSLSVRHVCGTSDGQPLPQVADGRDLGRDYCALVIVRGAALVCNEYVEAPGIAVLPPGTTEGVDLIHGSQALFVALGPAGKHDSTARLFVPLSPAGIKIEPTSSTAEMLTRQNQPREIRSLKHRGGANAYLSSFAKAKPGQDFSHTHWSGGELLLMLHGEVCDGRKTITPGTLCVNGPLTTHEPRPLTDMVALTVKLGTED